MIEYREGVGGRLVFRINAEAQEKLERVRLMVPRGFLVAEAGCWGALDVFSWPEPMVRNPRSRSMPRSGLAANGSSRSLVLRHPKKASDFNGSCRPCFLIGLTERVWSRIAADGVMRNGDARRRFLRELLVISPRTPLEVWARAAGPGRGSDALRATGEPFGVTLRVIERGIPTEGPTSLAHSSSPSKGSNSPSSLAGVGSLGPNGSLGSRLLKT